MRIGILGGSFDPIHKGHLTLAQEATRQFKLDKILFIPAALPPHKKEDFQLTPAPLRARMVALAIQDDPRWELSDLELRRPGPSYTVDTLRELRKCYPPPHELFFIAGADSFHDLKGWKNPEEILALCQWIVAPRVSSKLPDPLPPGFHLLRVAPIPISATELRDGIRRGENLSEWIPERVQDYLKKQKIYSEKPQ